MRLYKSSRDEAAILYHVPLGEKVEGALLLSEAEKKRAT